MRKTLTKKIKQEPQPKQLPHYIQYRIIKECWNNIYHRQVYHDLIGMSLVCWKWFEYTAAEMSINSVWNDDDTAVQDSNRVYQVLDEHMSSKYCLLKSLYQFETKTIPQIVPSQLFLDKFKSVKALVIKANDNQQVDPSQQEFNVLANIVPSLEIESLSFQRQTDDLPTLFKLIHNNTLTSLTTLKITRFIRVDVIDSLCTFIVDRRHTLQSITIDTMLTDGHLSGLVDPILVNNQELVFPSLKHFRIGESNSIGKTGVSHIPPSTLCNLNNQSRFPSLVSVWFVWVQAYQDGYTKFLNNTKIQVIKSVIPYSTNTHQVSQLMHTNPHVKSWRLSIDGNESGSIHLHPNVEKLDLTIYNAANGILNNFHHDKTINIKQLKLICLNPHPILLQDQNLLKYFESQRAINTLQQLSISQSDTKESHQELFKAIAGLNNLVKLEYECLNSESQIKAFVNNILIPISSTSSSSYPTTCSISNIVVYVKFSVIPVLESFISVIKPYYTVYHRDSSDLKFYFQKFQQFDNNPITINRQLAGLEEATPMDTNSNCNIM